MHVGFIGIGSMGGPIARRIAESGFAVTVYDVMPETLAAFDAPGSQRATDPIAAARAADVLGICVRMDADLVELTESGALFEALGQGGVMVIHSTVAPELCRALNDQAARYGVSIVDAGASGGGPAAARGELSMFVGGDPVVIEKVRPLLESYGRITILGAVGRGMEGKLLNNLISIANYGMSAAILDLGETLGFDRKTLSEALMAGSAQSFALRAVPGLIIPERAAAMRQLLGKDVEHARLLADADLPAMAALVPAAESMLARLERAAAEAQPRL